ncbi:MAG TPA: sugar phosphate isomerase/epimerase family protein [Vicinamibacterales bacterium]|jgi:sugar phosphate isomerase/epimerase|nr:sugar phosphate isomerase/epimerase family protein [Vicinamibacterales bacterium]
MKFAVSTHLYHDQRLERRHLEEIASYGFDAVEVFATRSHIDYGDFAAIESLASWLDATGLRLHGIHAPITDRLGKGDAWGRKYSIAAADAALRDEAVREVNIALDLVRRIRSDVVVLHLGVPDAQNPGAGDNSREAMRRSVAEIGELTAIAGVRLALEVIPNALSTPEALVRLLEEDFAENRLGICLDFGHAFLMGDVVDAVEQVAGHIVTTHVHDNQRRTDDHLAPFDGAIEWPAAMMAVQKVGYEGTLVFEVANTSTTREVLGKVRAARDRFEQIVTGWPPTTEQ